MRRAAMALIFNWGESAAQYGALYRDLEASANASFHA